MATTIYTITRISLSSAGVAGNHASGDVVISPDGTEAVFGSNADNLVAGDTNGVQDLFLYNIASGTTTRLDLGPGGVQSNGLTVGPVQFSADSSKIVFASAATNLVAGDTNSRADVFVETLATGAIVRANTDLNGVQSSNAVFSQSGTAISADGNLVAFDDLGTNLVPGDTNGVSDVFVKNLTTGAIVRASTDSAGVQGNNTSVQPFFSKDATLVAFYSLASNLVAGDTNGSYDLFVKTLATGAIIRASTSSGGVEGNADTFDSLISFSPDGTKIAFSSSASNLVAGDTNGAADIFVKTISGPGAGTIVRVSTDSSGGQANGGSSLASFSPDGTKLMFTSNASNLVAGDTNGVADVFVKDLVTGATTLVSTNPAGTLGDGMSAATGIWTNNGLIGFHSSADNLVANDIGGHQDAFIISLNAPAPPTASTPPTPIPAPRPPVAADIEKNFGSIVGVSFTAAKTVSPTVTLPDGTTAPNPLYADEQATLQIKAQYLTGAINFTQAMDQLVNLSGSTSVVAYDTYRFFGLGPPTAAGLQYLLDSTANPTDLTDSYYAGFNEAQRFMNFGVGLAMNGPATALFAQNYGGLSFDAAVRQAYEAVIGTGYAIVAGIDVNKAVAYLDSQQAYFSKVGGSDLGAKAAMIGFLMSAGFDAHVGLYYNAAHDYLTGTASLAVTANDIAVGLVGAATDAAPLF